ncbi:hypothetical protein FACUT_11227 [Fusarium acutatum]|uniref:Uncharacterized protein n=1 Tax=Fusarium acutatum TaxID=78861 RepID=A0A8H4JDI1_9HYPO|nr:hypothetical protein FACUT_11227 [Fusarium acutatum]
MDEHNATDQNRSPFTSAGNHSTSGQQDTELKAMNYCSAVRKECASMEVDSNHRFIYVVPENGAVVFFQGMNQAAATLDKDYMAKACEMLLKTHFENHGGVVPRVHAKILVFEIVSFPEAPLLNAWDTEQHAHGSYTDAHNHVRDWVVAVLNVSTDMGIEFHLCRPWRDFGFLKGATTPLRDAGYDLSVALEEVNWLQVSDQFISFLKAMTVRAVTGEPLDDANLQFQSNLTEDIAGTLVGHGNRFIRY